MTDTLRHFTNEGIAAFSKWLQAGAIGAIPRDLVVDPEFSELMGKTNLLNSRRFKDRYEFGVLLVELLKPFDSHEISYDRGLWAWLAAWFFDQLCPLNVDGSRTLRKEYVYIPNEPRIYYRHLVRTPWYLVSTHGEASKFLLISPHADDPAPLSRQSYLLDQLAARQFVIASPTLIAAAKQLYTSPHTGLQRRGAGAKGKGSPRRLAIVANQLSLTFDIRDMPVENFMKLLPVEFSYRF
jgi:hypothetical protein